MSKERTQGGSRPGGLGRAGLAVVLGQAAALGVTSAYAYGTANLVWSFDNAAYGALAVVPVAGLAAIAITAGMLRLLHVSSRGLFSVALALSALIGYALATPARLYPPERIFSQLPGLLDASPSLARAIEDIRTAPFPVVSSISLPDALWFYLAGEALVLGFVMLAVRDTCLSTPVCVACRRWCKRTRAIAERAFAAPAQAIERAQACDWVFFRGLGAPRPGAGSRLRFDSASCPQCRRTHTLSLTLVRRFWRNRLLVRDARVTEDDIRTVRAMERS